MIIHSESKRIIAYHQNNIESVVAFGKEENIVATVGRIYLYYSRVAKTAVSTAQKSPLFWVIRYR